ncbi:MAG: hypothetical protein GAK38_04477 [Xylophilus sp.]|nr:MAG: hypothetical protein GAK38_04477 [Xylophilus sp.]
MFTQTVAGFKQQKRLILKIACVDAVTIGQCMIAAHGKKERVLTNFGDFKIIKIIGMGHECHVKGA